MIGAEAFIGITATIFVAELTDKDALLLLALATRTQPLRVFLAGAVAFTFTTPVIVAAGAYAISIVPIIWIKLAGGGVMLAYGAWEAVGAFGQRPVRKEEERIERARGELKAFFLMVGALALLDLAGDATEVLTIVFVAQYSNALLVFTCVLAGLLAATAVETSLGNQLKRTLTPERMRYVATAVFLVLGATIVATSL